MTYFYKTKSGQLSRRRFLLSAPATLLAFSYLADCFQSSTAAAADQTPQTNKKTLKQFNYGQIKIADESIAGKQFAETMATLLAISDDTMLKPYRQRAGIAAPGVDMGGWYDNYAAYDWHSGAKDADRGFAPGHCFGQWLSALARAYAITGDRAYQNKVNSLVEGYSLTISPAFYQDLRFPAYTYDKLVLGLSDAYTLAGCQQAQAALEATTRIAAPFLPLTAVDREVPVAGRDASYTWDESYTLPENLFIAYQRGAGDQYLTLAKRFLLDKTYFEPLAQGKNALVGKHAYSYMNALSSAMQAYLVTDSPLHLEAAKNAFTMIDQAQSFATGGWGPDELFQPPGTGALYKSLTKSHHSFETPCGAYAHLKLTRYLLAVTKDSRYADSAERVFYNTILGAKPLQKDGRAFYYSDYNIDGSKVFSNHGCPCCAGTLPQVACDYGINTYMHDDSGLYVSLYLNSTVDFEHRGQAVKVSQSGEYPQNGKIKLLVSGTAEPMSLHLRIPAWADAEAVKLSLNGQSCGIKINSGRFVTINRIWQGGDLVALELPMTARVEAIDEQHPQTVAIIVGPRVLFALRASDDKIKDDKISDDKIKNGAPQLPRATLLAVQQQAPDKWTAAGIEFVPFTAINDEKYSCYVEVT